MPARWLVRWSVCLAIGLALAATAWAAAPICDERGASSIAPPPILPAHDVRLEAGFALFCIDFDVFGPGDTSVAPGPPQAPDELTSDYCVPMAQAWPSTPRSGRLTVSPFVSVGRAAGHRPGVFHPPRP